MKRISLLSLVVCLLFPISSFAQGQGRIFSIVEAPSSVRSAGMGNVTLGNTDEMYLYTNPSALVFSNKEFSVDFSTEFYPDSSDGRLKQYNFSTAYKLGHRHAIFAGGRYNGLPISGSDFYNWTTDFGYAFEVIPELVAFATGSYGENVVGNKKAKGLMFSVGLGYQKKLQNNSLLTLGLRLQDFGKPVKFNNTGISYDLPASLSLGGDYSMKLSKEHQFTYGLSMRYFMPKGGERLQVNTGAEYSFMDLVSARLGYQYAQREGSRLTMGLGLKYAGVKFNISYQKTFDIERVDLFMFGLGFEL